MPIRRQLLDAFREKRNRSEFWLQVLLYGCLAVVFWPITQWIAASTEAQSRLLHAMIVLLLAVIVLIRLGDVRIERPLSFHSAAGRSMVLTYALLVIGLLGSRWVHPVFSLLGLTAFCAGVASLVLFVFGPKVRRLTYTAAGTFGLFLLLSTFMHALDWPLRRIAGEWSAELLAALGQSTRLGLWTEAGVAPKLILLVNEHPFHVAAECNGFGVILTSLLLAVLLSLYRSVGIVGLAFNATVAIALGLTFNLIRIVIIVLLAPLLMDHYMLMHEIVGGITYWSCLVLVWVVLRGPTQWYREKQGQTA